MRYLVTARYIETRLADFYRALTDGTIEAQKPDGREIVASMKRARIAEPGVIRWHETCYCPTPLKHERETVYDRYLRDIRTVEVDRDMTLEEGESFWVYLKERALTR